MSRKNVERSATPWAGRCQSAVDRRHRRPRQRRNTREQFANYLRRTWQCSHEEAETLITAWEARGALALLPGMELPLAEMEASCESCGATDNLDGVGMVKFCRDCLEHSKQSLLDEDYDDLGVGD